MNDDWKRQGSTEEEYKKKAEKEWTDREDEMTGMDEE